MDKPQIDHQSMLTALDQLSQTVTVMSDMIGRLQNHVEHLIQERAALTDESMPRHMPAKSRGQLH
jgi:regulator of replication initiation timing